MCTTDRLPELPCYPSYLSDGPAAARFLMTTMATPPAMSSAVPMPAMGAKRSFEPVSAR